MCLFPDRIPVSFCQSSREGWWGCWGTGPRQEVCRETRALDCIMASSCRHNESRSWHFPDLGTCHVEFSAWTLAGTRAAECLDYERGLSLLISSHHSRLSNFHVGECVTRGDVQILDACVNTTLTSEWVWSSAARRLHRHFVLVPVTAGNRRLHCETLLLLIYLILLPSTRSQSFYHESD